MLLSHPPGSTVPRLGTSDPSGAVTTGASASVVDFSAVVVIVESFLLLLTPPAPWLDPPSLLLNPSPSWLDPSSL